MPYAGQVDKTMGAETVGHLKHLLETELKRACEENDLHIAMFLGVDGRIFSSSIPNKLDPREYRLLNLLKGNLAHICSQLAGQNMMMSVQQFEARVGVVDIAEVALVADDLRAAESVEHAPALRGIAPVGVADRIDEVQIADVRLDLLPVVRVLEHGLLGGVRARRVAGDEDRLRDPRVDVLQDAEQERSAARVPDEHGAVVKCVR